jgi:murein DD-endopeptidase MepM/ murein hydrolase activator NlpD
MLKIVCLLIAAFTVGACASFHPQVENSRQRYYFVQPDDNFYSIAFALEITPQQLQRANPWLKPLNIAPGMRLSVPHHPLDDNYANANKIYPDDQIDDSDRVVVQDQHTDYIWPVRRIDVSSDYGYRRGNLHAGIDLRAPLGTRIFASAAGRVIFSGHKRGYGNLIVIDHGGGTETAYAHNSRNIAKKGQRVNQGQVVATVGRSGNATGYHVHFEFRRHGKAVNPVRYVQAAL